MKTNMIQKSVISTFLFFFSAFVLIAQPDDRINRVRAQKAAYITQRLNLSVEKSQSFWPIYNEFEDKMFALKKQRFGEGKPKHPNIEELSDNEIQELLNSRFRHEEEVVKLKREYHEKYLKVLSIREVAMLYEAEHEFRKDLIHRLKRGEERTRH